MKGLSQFSYLKHLTRKYSTKTKIKVIPDEKTINDINENVYTPKKHPGIFKPTYIELPKFYVSAITKVLADFPVKSVVEEGELFNRRLKHKTPPIEKKEAKEKIKRIQNIVQEKLGNFKINNELDEARYQQAFQHKVMLKLKKEVYTWKPVNYDTYSCLVYLMGRTAAEYAVLVKIFNELKIRDPTFKPKSLFDFGSGVGTVTWAANEFWNSFLEYFNVDSSRDMNDLAQTILKGGIGSKNMPHKGIFYRQFLPAANISYDLVVSAYTLLELPSRESRLQTLVNLWNKTEKYLVLVEHGTNAGFQLINEARDFVLHNKTLRNGHVISPCPHDTICPRFKARDETPCNFQVFYGSLPIGANTQRNAERYSYVVLKKGPRDSSDPQWPRLVRETLVRSKHSICNMCAKNGKLEQVVFTASKHGKTMYHCARASKWGDLLPINIEESDLKEEIISEEGIKGEDNTEESNTENNNKE